MVSMQVPEAVEPRASRIKLKVAVGTGFERPVLQPNSRDVSTVVEPIREPRRTLNVIPQSFCIFLNLINVIKVDWLLSFTLTHEFQIVIMVEHFLRPFLHAHSFTQRTSGHAY